MGQLANRGYHEQPMKRPNLVGKIVGTATPITANSYRWLYVIQPVQGYPDLSVSETDPDFEAQLVTETFPGLNLGEFGNSATAVGDFDADNIPSSFTVNPITGFVLYEMAFMVFDQATGADPEVGCFFYGINAIDGGCS